jgi:tetratricopeptide (TPR) repeat protein
MRWWIRSLSRSNLSAPVRISVAILGSRLVLASTLVASALWAQPADPGALRAGEADGGTIADGGAPATENTEADPATLEARALFDQGKRAYDSGQFKDALKLYSDAYRIRPLPGFLFNIGQCHRLLGNYQSAAFFFGRYLDAFPTAPNASVAKSLLVEAETRRKAQEEEERVRVVAALEEGTKARSDAQSPGGVFRDLTSKWWVWGIAGGVLVVGITAALVAQPQARPASLGTINHR